MKYFLLVHLIMLIKGTLISKNLNFISNESAKFWTKLSPECELWVTGVKIFILLMFWHLLDDWPETDAILEWATFTIAHYFERNLTSQNWLWNWNRKYCENLKLLQIISCIFQSSISLSYYLGQNLINDYIFKAWYSEAFLMQF